MGWWRRILCCDGVPIRFFRTGLFLGCNIITIKTRQNEDNYNYEPSRQTGFASIEYEFNREESVLTVILGANVKLPIFQEHLQYQTSPRSKNAPPKKGSLPPLRRAGTQSPSKGGSSSKTTDRRDQMHPDAELPVIKEGDDEGELL